MKKRNKKEVTIKFMVFEIRNLSYIRREVIINLYTGTVLPFLRLLELKSCTEKKICDISKIHCYKKSK